MLCAGLLVTGPGHSVDTDGRVIRQIHGGYWQLITE